MSLTTTDKVKINKYIRENKIGEIYYQEMCDAIGKRGKVSDLEFLEYFTDSVIHEFKKNVKLSIKHVAKLVQAVDMFLDWMIEEEAEVELKILDKIVSFEEFYQEYLARMNYEIDEDLNENYIKPLVEKVREQLAEYRTNESVTIYIKKINELEEQVSHFVREVANLEMQLEKTKKTIEQKQTKIDTLGNSLTSSKNEVSNKTSEIKLLEMEIEELNSKIKSLEEEIEIHRLELEEKIKLLDSEMEIKNGLLEELSKLKEEIESLNLTIKELQKKVKNEENRKKQAEKLIVKENALQSLIYETLLTNNKSVDELVELANNEGLTTNVSQILDLLRRMRNGVNITTSSFMTKPTYKITPPHISETGIFSIDLPYGCKFYDIMLVSDFHITEFDEKTIGNFDKLNEYCTKNGINLVLNLGDFFEGFCGRVVEYENMVKNYKNVEAGINLIPRVEGIYHAILGGNHDRNIIAGGFDPIKLLTDAREDLINLGYSHSAIAINNPEQTLGEFDIHHPDTFDFPIALEEDGIDIEKIRNYLENIYVRNNRDRENSYIDIFGHTHKSQFNSSDSYCFVPSFFRGHSRKGAMHLRVYFDEDKSIKYMVFMPLNFNSGLVKNNEIVYQKQLTR